MKKRLFCIFIIICAFVFSGSSYSGIINEQLETAEKSGFTEHISEKTIEILNRSGLENMDFETLSNLSFGDFIKILFNAAVLEIKEPFTAIITVLVAIIVCAVIGCFGDEFFHMRSVMDTVTTLSACAVIIIPIKNVISNSAEVIRECSDFMLAFIPVYSSAIASCGYISSSAGFRTIMLGAATVVSRLAGEIIVPLLCIYLALCVAGSVSAVDIGEISKSVKNFAVWVLCSVMAIFSGIMGLGTLVTSSSDGVLSKTAKFIVGSAIPIVGGSVSDALATVKSCLNLTKNILGVYAIIVIAVIFVPPIVNILLWRICLSAACGVGNIFGNKNISLLVSSSSSVMGIMLALVSVTAVMFIFSLCIMLMIGGGG